MVINTFNLNIIFISIYKNDLHYYVLYNLQRCKTAQSQSNLEITQKVHWTGQ